MTAMEEYFKKSSTRDLLRRKLQEVISEGTQVCDNLVDYICLLCMNKMTDNEQDAKKTFQEDLNAFFGDENSEIFTTWIWKHMRRFREYSQEVVQSDFPVDERKSTTRRDRRTEKTRNRHKRSRSRSRTRESRKHGRARSTSTERSRRRGRGLPQKKRASPKKRERNLFSTVLSEIQAGSSSSKLNSYGGRVKPPAEPLRITTQFETLPTSRSSVKSSITVKRPERKSKKSKRKILLDERTSVSRRQRKVLLDSKEEDTNSAIEEILANDTPAQTDMTPPGEQTENDVITVKEEDEKREISPQKTDADPEFVISFAGQANRVNKAKHKRRFITEESVGKLLAKQETNAALVIEDPTLLTGPDSTICWDYFSIVGCQRSPCKWRHELPENRNVKLEVIDMNLLQPVLKYSEMLLRRIGQPRGLGFRGLSRGRGRGWVGSRVRGRGRGRTARVYPNMSWAAEDENSILECEGDVPTPCFFDPVCERIGCHFQHPERTARAKKFLESSKDKSSNRLESKGETITGH